jgi:hypothetical protein
MRISTWRSYSILRRCENFHDIASVKACTNASDFNFDGFAGNSMAHKDDRTFMASNEVATVSYLFNLNPNPRPYLERAFLGQ